MTSKVSWVMGMGGTWQIPDFLFDPLPQVPPFRGSYISEMSMFWGSPIKTTLVGSYARWFPLTK